MQLLSSMSCRNSEALHCNPQALHCPPQALHCNPQALNCNHQALHCNPQALHWNPQVLHCNPHALHCKSEALYCNHPWAVQVRGADKIAELSDHVIVCGAEESFHNFIEQLRRCDPMRPPVVILHPKPPKSWSLLQSMFRPLHFVQVTPP